MKAMTIGGRIEKKRKDAGWTQTELAEKSGVAPSAISQIENNKRHPSTIVLKKIANALSVSMDYLLGEKEEDEIQDLMKNKDIEIFFRDYKELTSDQKGFIRKQVEYFKSQKKK